MTAQTTAEFIDILIRKYHNNCKRFSLTPTMPGMVQYLLNHQVIPEKVVQKYMVLELYPQELYNHDSKTEAVQHLSDRTGVCERTVWYLLQDQTPFVPSSAR